MVVFNPAGEQVYSGHPSGADKAIKDALKEVSDETLAAASTESGSGFGLTTRPKNLITERQWTNSKGQTMTAAVVSLSGNTATFKLQNGTNVPYDITNLSEADQATIREAAEEEKGSDS